jgi:lipopolysaccharide transport system permease protein
MFSLKKIYAYRVLTWTLILKELKGRYRGSALGLFWTLLNPLFMMLVYTLVFSVYMRVQIEDYAVFVFAGLLPWLWFSSSAMHSTVAVIRDGQLLKKVTFPAEILPFVAVSANFVNFLFSLPLYFIFCLVFGVPLGKSLIFLPLLMALEFLLQYGLALFLSAVTVIFRDFEHLTGNILTLLFFLTPILYPVEFIPERFRAMAMANPVAPMVLAYRDVLFYNRLPRWEHLAWFAGSALFLIFVGEVTFNRLRARFAEEV